MFGIFLIIIGGVFLLIFAGLVEAYVSHSLLPKPFKIIFGIGSGIAMYSYLGFSGRPAATGRANVKAEL